MAGLSLGPIASERTLGDDQPASDGGTGVGYDVVSIRKQARRAAVNGIDNHRSNRLQLDPKLKRDLVRQAPGVPGIGVTGTGFLGFLFTQTKTCFPCPKTGTYLPPWTCM